MEKHPKAGQPVKIANGPFKGQYFVVTDYLVNQYQGKQIEKIAKSQGHLLYPMQRRGYPIDDKAVFGRIYPGMEFICVHDDELRVDLSVVETDAGPVELPPNVAPMLAKGKGKARLKSVTKDKKEDGNGPDSAS